MSKFPDIQYTDYFALSLGFGMIILPIFNITDLFSNSFYISLSFASFFLTFAEIIKEGPPSKSQFYNDKVKPRIIFSLYTLMALSLIALPNAESLLNYFERYTNNYVIMALGLSIFYTGIKNREKQTEFYKELIHPALELNSRLTELMEENKAFKIKINELESKLKGYESDI